MLKFCFPKVLTERSIRNVFIRLSSTEFYTDSHALVNKFSATTSWVNLTFLPRLDLGIVVKGMC